MPSRSERTLWTIGIIRDDVDGWNVGVLVDRQVVVGDLSSIFLGEV